MAVFENMYRIPTPAMHMHSDPVYGAPSKSLRYGMDQLTHLMKQKILLAPMTETDNYRVSALQ